MSAELPMPWVRESPRGKMRRVSADVGSGVAGVESLSDEDEDEDDDWVVRIAVGIVMMRMRTMLAAIKA